MKIKLSFVICTYNAPKLIRKCLDSILRQKTRFKFEIIIVDGDSDNETLDLIKEYERKFKNIRLIDNKKQLPEGRGYGKWLGWKSAKGEFVAIVDQDNELRGNNWMADMLNPFSKEKIFGCACRLFLKKDDNLTNKYIAVMGTDPVAAYKSLDGVINIKNIGEKRKDYLILKIDKENALISGGNCFIYRKKYLDEVGGYTQDVENIKRLLDAGYNELAIPDNAFTYHNSVSGFGDFIRKKKKWASAYFKKQGENFKYTASKAESRKFIINLFFIFTVFPNVFLFSYYAIKRREKVLLLHPILSLITALIYFSAVRKRYS